MLLSRVRLGFDVLMMVVFAWVFYESMTEFTTIAGYFPRTIAAVALFVGTINLVVSVRRLRRYGTAIGSQESSTATILESDDPDDLRQAIRRALVVLGWLIGFVVLAAIVGVPLATILFLMAFFLHEEDISWKFAVVATVVTSVLLVVAFEVLSLRWPESVLPNVLPWAN